MPLWRYSVFRCSFCLMKSVDAVIVVFMDPCVNFCPPHHKVRKGVYWIFHRLSVHLSLAAAQKWCLYQCSTLSLLKRGHCSYAYIGLKEQFPCWVYSSMEAFCIVQEIFLGKFAVKINVTCHSFNNQQRETMNFSLIIDFNVISQQVFVSLWEIDFVRCAMSLTFICHS